MLRTTLLSLLVLVVALAGGTVAASRATLAAGPDFTLAANPPSIDLSAGGTAGTEVVATPTGGFASFVSMSVSGLPAGVTASVIPAPVPSPAPAGGIDEVQLTASTSAATTSATITVTATGGGITHTLGIPLQVAGFVSDFGIQINPPALTVAAGSSATATITAVPASSAPAFSAHGLPTGVTAAFGPTTIANGASTTALTLTAASAAPAGVASVAITATAGSSTGTATLTLTVTGGGGTGSVTVSPAINANGPWFDEDDVKLANSTPLTALSVAIVVQRTAGVSFSGQFDTVGGQVVQSSTSTATTITYQFTLNAGQTVPAGSGWTFAAQASGSGTFHPTAGDTFAVTWTTGGQTFTQSGHYPEVDPA
jgi:hypothetical protein